MPFARAFGEGETGQHGRDDDGKDQRAKQRKGHGPGHGLEEAAFDALQREDRQEGGNGDDDGVEHRALHFVRGVADALGGGLGAAVGVTHVAHDVFDQNDGAFHDHAEIERAEREQVGGNVHQVEADGGEEQRERNGGGNDERAADIAQKQKQNDRDQDHAFGEVVQHGVTW